MSSFPEKFKVRVIEKDNGTPISNVAISITLFANRKNNYHFVPPISSHEGIIEFTKDWLGEEILKEQKLFIMDYSSNLEDCKPMIEINVMKSEKLENVVRGMETFAGYFKYTKNDIDQIRNVDNRKYKPISVQCNVSELESFSLVLELDRL